MGLVEVASSNIVIVDPPQRGLGQSVVMKLSSCASVRFVFYLSCGQKSFCEDSLNFLNAGFKLSELRCYDSFPSTNNIEIFGVFSRSSAVSHWHRASPRRTKN